VLALDTDPGTGEVVPGSAQVMVIRTPAEKLVWLRALASRRAEGITALLAFFTGFLIVDGYTAYQQLGQLAGIQQCCQHVIRRCRAVTRLGPGSLQTWAADVITVLCEAHQAVEDARSSGEPGQQPDLDAALLAGLRERYDTAVAFGIIHNRLRDWDGDGNHPGYALGCWLREHAGRCGCSPPPCRWSGPATPPSARSKASRGHHSNGAHGPRSSRVARTPRSSRSRAAISSGSSMSRSAASGSASFRCWSTVAGAAAGWAPRCY
jgi:hypothetical protein